MPRANGATTRRLGSWIDAYLDHTKDLPAPEIFRLWSAIGTVGAALERRCWVTVAGLPTYPNLFILLVGRPGVGKTNALNPATSLMREAGVFHIMPKDVNRATFLKWLASEETRDREINREGVLEEYHSGILHLSEFGVFLKAHELDLLSMVCDIFDCPYDYENRRVYQGKDIVVIPNPQISILAGTQPGFLSNTFPAEAWSQGFMARVIMVHCGTPSRPSLFDAPKRDLKLKSALVSDLLEMKGMKGEFDFSQEAKDALQAWYNDGACNGGGHPVPTFPRLESYNTRRILHMLKLCQVSSAARNSTMRIELEDFEISLDWMLQAEKTMPDVFLEMAGRNDGDVLRELWHYAWTHWVAKKQAMHKSRLMAFLSVRVPAWQAEKMLETAAAAGYFSKGGKDMWEPRPKNEWGTV